MSFLSTKLVDVGALTILCAAKGHIEGGLASVLEQLICARVEGLLVVGSKQGHRVAGIMSGSICWAVADLLMKCTCPYGVAPQLILMQTCLLAPAPHDHIASKS